MAKKILIVDDENEMVKLIELNLIDKGFDTITAFSGEEAIEKAALAKPDLVLLDVVLQDTDGFSVCAKLKKANPQTKVLIYTGKPDGVNVPKARQAGADDFAVKTADLSHVMKSIENIFENNS